MSLKHSHLYELDWRDGYTIEMIAEIHILQISLLDPLPLSLLMHIDRLQLVHIDGPITTTRVHLIIIEGDTPYRTSMTSKSSKEAFIAAIVHVGGMIRTTRV